MKNTFKENEKNGKKSELQTKIVNYKVKQRSGGTNIDNIIEKNEAEKKAEYYGAGGKDEVSELEKGGRREKKITR